MESKLMHGVVRRVWRPCLLLLLALPGLALPGLTLAQALAQAENAASEGAIQADFDAALQAIEADRLRTARKQLTTLLAANPSLSRARLELARVNYLSRDYAAARSDAQQVLDDPNTPPTVRATVLAFLAQIAADERRYAARHQWSPSFYGGVMYDSNINYGLAQDIIDIGGLPFAVSADSREQSGWAAVVNTGMAHTFNPNRPFEAGEHTGNLVWQSEANAYYRAYFDDSDFNLGVLTARTGPAWIVPGRWRAYVALQADQIFLGGESLALFGSLNPGAVWQVGEDWEVALDGIVTGRDYQNAEDRGRDGWYEAGNLSVGRYFRQRSLLVQVGATYANFDADEKPFSYQGPEVFAGFNSAAWTNASIFARVGYRWYHFDGEEPGFATQRDDQEIRAVIGFQQDFREGWLEKWALIGSWGYTDNQSNVPLYEYDRHQVSLGLSRNF